MVFSATLINLQPLRVGGCMLGIEWSGDLVVCSPCMFLVLLYSLIPSIDVCNRHAQVHTCTAVFSPAYIGISARLQYRISFDVGMGRIQKL